MKKVIGRLGTARNMVSKTVRKDLKVRRTERADAGLNDGIAGNRVSYPARAPYSRRSLPATTVHLQSPREYSAALKGKIQAALTGSGVRSIDVTDSGAPTLSIGLNGADWLRALKIISDAIPGALFGASSGRVHASKVAYTARPESINGMWGAPTVFVLLSGVTMRGGRAVKKYGFECAIRLERWSPALEHGYVFPEVWNPRTGRLQESAFESVAAKSGDPELDKPTAEVFDVPHLMEVDFPIDVVYTWVDGTDPSWVERKRKALEMNSGERMPEASVDDLRFVGHDELRYSLRALELYAPWVRHVYIVTDAQRPSWLREDSKWVSVVDHRDIAPKGTNLPTFNSQAIEANLHRIDGLSEHFLYLNDDMFLSSPIKPEVFFQGNGISSVFLSRSHVDIGEPVEGEPAPDAAGKNARRLVFDISGKRIGRKLFHAPYALRRSVSYEIEERWPDLIQDTRDSQFRSLEDVTLSGGLHLNYAFATGRAVTRSIRYRYVGIGEASASRELRRLHSDRDRLQTFCLNDAVQEIPSHKADELVREFLMRRFPDMGSFERS